MKGKGVRQFKPAMGIDAVAAAAHELKAPLALINHLADALNDPEYSLTKAERHQYLSRLRFTSERMVRLVQQLTLSYRLENDAQAAFAFKTEPVNMSEIGSAVLHELTPYAREHRQHLQLNQVRCNHVAVANRDILHDMVVNLVDNAIRHNPDGGTVRLASQCHGERVRLSVSDTGPGVDAADLRRLHKTLGVQPQLLTGRPDSSGLGLYIAGQFAQAMGGTLGVGRATVGATFFVDLLKSHQLRLL